MAWAFDGSNDYVLAADNAAFTLPDGNFTIHILMRNAAVSGWSGRRVLYGSGLGGGSDGELDISVGHSGGVPNNPAIYMADDGYASEIDIPGTGTPLNNTNWHSIDIERNGSTISIYVDDVLNDSGAVGNVDAFNGNTGWYFGRYWGSAGNWYQGDMAEFAIFTRALGADRVKLWNPSTQKGVPANHSSVNANLAAYIPMRTGDYTEKVVGVTITNNGTTGATHPNISVPQAVAGTSTNAGSFSSKKVFAAPLSGASSSAGALSSDVVADLVQKLLEGASTSAGALSWLISRTKALSGASTNAGAASSTELEGLTHISCTENSTGNATSLNTTVTVPAATSNRILIVFIAVLDTALRNITAVTCGGNALTLVSTESRGTAKLEVWRLDDENMPAAGSRTLAVTVNNGSRILVAAHFVSHPNPIIIRNSSDGNASATGITVSLNNTGKNLAATLALSAGIVAVVQAGGLLGSLPTWTNASSVAEDDDFGTQVTEIGNVYAVTMGTGHKVQDDAGAFTHVWNHNFGSAVDVLGAGVVLDERPEPVEKTVIGASVNAGALLWTIARAKAVAGTSSNVGAIANFRILGTVLKLISGASASAGALTRSIVRLKALSGASTNAGAVRKRIRKLLASASNSAGAVATDLTSVYRMALEWVDARVDGTVKYLVTLSNKPITGSTPENYLFDNRLIEPPTFTRGLLDQENLISGLSETTVRFNNYDGLFKNKGNLEGYYARVERVFAALKEEISGVVTRYVRGIENEAQVSDQEAELEQARFPRRLTSVELFPNLPDKDAGQPIVPYIGRNRKARCLLIQNDIATSEFYYLIGEGVGISGNLKTVFAAYHGDVAFEDYEGTVQGVTGSAITLESQERRRDEYYRFWFVQLVDSSTGAVLDEKFVSAYNGTTNRITPNSSWAVSPSGKKYRVKPWRFYSGSQSSPFGGFGLLRFKINMTQRGSLPEIYVDLDGFQGEKNRVRAIQSILSNNTWGFGYTVDNTTFDALAEDEGISALDTEGGQKERVDATEVLTSLLEYREMRLRKEGGVVKIDADMPSSSVGTFRLGTELPDNIISVDSGGIDYGLSREKIKTLIVVYRESGKEAGVWLGEQRGDVHTRGHEETITLPWAYSHESANQELYYKIARLIAASETLIITVNEDGETLNARNVITLDMPQYGIDGDWEIKQIERGNGTYTLTLNPDNQDRFEYEPVGDIPDDLTEAIATDFTSTPPAQVTGLTISQGIDVVSGIPYPSTTLRWTAPEENYSQSVVSIKVTSAPVEAFVEVGKGVSSIKIGGGVLLPGLPYDYLVEPLNEAGTEKGQGSSLTNQVAGGDDTTPSVPTGLTGSSGLADLTWAFNRVAGATVSGYWLEVYIASSGGSFIHTEFIEQPASGTLVRSKPYKAINDTLTNGVTRWAQVKTMKFNGKESAFTSRASATTKEIKQGDITDGEISDSWTNSSDGPQPIITLSVNVSDLRADQVVDIEVTFQVLVATEGFPRISRGATVLEQPASGFLDRGTHTLQAYDPDPPVGSATYTFNATNLVSPPGNPYGDAQIYVHQRKR